MELPIATGGADPQIKADDVISFSDLLGDASLRGTLLYIEDNPDNQALMERIVAQIDGLDIQLARSAEIGLSIAQQAPPDIIIMDINLPGMGGLAATRKLRALHGCANIPVFAVSANPTEDIKTQAREAGCNDFLAKPINLQHLLISLRRTFEGQRK